MTRRPLPFVTDHAVLRYLERAQGVDIEAVRAEIGRKVRRGVDAGACGVLIDGVRFVLRGESVVTVLERSWPLRPQDVEGRRE